LASRLLLVVVLFAVAIIGLSHSPASASGYEPVRGDIDCSGEIDVADVTRLLAYLGGTENSVGPGCPFVITQTVEGVAWGDFDCAAGVGVADALALLLDEAGDREAPDSCPPIGSTVGTGPGPAVCDMLFAASYRYTSHFYYRIFPPPNSVGGAAIPQPHDFYSSQTGAVEDGVNRQGYIRNLQWPNDGDLEVVIVGDRQWRRFDEFDDWQEIFSDLLAYEPASYCQSLAPDIDTSLITGTADTVDGVPAAHLYFRFPNNWSRRHADFGPNSDVTRYVHEFEGSIWVAEDSRFITKMNIIGHGQYEDGTSIEVRAAFTVYDLYDETIEILPPVP
jgi:hypothetical protein